MTGRREILIVKPRLAGCRFEWRQCKGKQDIEMRKLKMGARVRIAAALAAAAALSGHAQSPAAAKPAPQNAASLNDTLLAKATTLYASTTKSGLRSFDCQVHPDWKKIMSSARKGDAIAADDPKLTLLGAVKITLHAKVTGDSTLDWQVPDQWKIPPGSADASTLDQAHHGMEQTLTGMLKLWGPLADGTVPESLGEEGVQVTKIADGYRLISNTKEASVTEEFDGNLLLKHFVTTSSGTTVDIEPAFDPTPQGLLLKSFVAHVKAPEAAAAGPQEIDVSLDYQTLSGMQVPARFDINLPGLVEMDFALDGCAVNPASN